MALHFHFLKYSRYSHGFKRNINLNFGHIVILASVASLYKLEIKKEIVAVKDQDGKWQPVSASQHQQSSTHLATTSSNSTHDNDIGDTIATDSVHTESETMPQSTIFFPVPDIAETAIVVGDVHQITDNVSEECAGKVISVCVQRPSLFH
jgi:hypothetical protein